MSKLSKRQQARQGERCRIRREAPKRIGHLGTLLDLFVAGTRVNPFPRLRMDKRKQRRQMRKRFCGGMIDITIHRDQVVILPKISGLLWDELDNFECVSEPRDTQRLRVEGVNAAGEHVVEYVDLPANGTPVYSTEIVFPPRCLTPIDPRR